MARHMTIPISQLMVNPSNPRFEPVQDQNQATLTMLNQEEDTIKKLAKDIVKYGLNPTKNLAVYLQNGKYTVLEGNRRIVALKLLDDPSITDNLELQNFFKALKDKNNITFDMPCTVFDNRDDAKHWIMLEHTGQNQGAGVVPWNPIQKDRFLNKSSHLLNLIEYVGNDLDYSNVDQSSLSRLIATPDVRKKIGISFSKGKVKELKPRAAILANFSRVFSAMSKDDFAVRKIYYAGDRKQWIESILSNGDNIKNELPPNSRPLQDLPRSSSREHLIPNDCSLGIFEPRINDVFLELRDSLILGGKNSTPNAVAVLFRVFLEISLDKYIAVMNISMPGNPKLKEKIDKITAHMITNNIATHTQLLAIRRTSTGSLTDILNIQWFHQYVHNSTILPETDGLKAKWDNLQRFFEILWGHINNNGQYSHGI